jgi:hypothetical protein
MNVKLGLTLIPCILDMARSGLSARSVRIVLKAWMPPTPAKEAVKLISDTYNSRSACKNLVNVNKQKKKNKKK